MEALLPAAVLRKLADRYAELLVATLAERLVSVVSTIAMASSRRSSIACGQRRLGSRRIRQGTTWYWDLKPDFKRGDTFEI